MFREDRLSHFMKSPRGWGLAMSHKKWALLSPSLRNGHTHCLSLLSCWLILDTCCLLPHLVVCSHQLLFEALTHVDGEVALGVIEL
jgi:hypothetical protein